MTKKLLTGSGEVGVFASRGWLRIEDILLGREFALIGMSRPGAVQLFRFLDIYCGFLSWLCERLVGRVPGWFFNFLIGFILRAGKAALLRHKLSFLLLDPTGCADHPEWEGVL